LLITYWGFVIVYDFIFLYGRYTDEEKLLAQPGPCTVEVRDASDLTQKEFLSK
jgi:hypothetical protein